MELTRYFDNLRFPQRIIREIVNRIERSAKTPNKPDVVLMSVSGKEGTWQFDEIEDFFDAYGTGSDDATFMYEATLRDAKGRVRFYLAISHYGSNISVSSPRKSDIMEMFNFLEESRGSASPIKEEVQHEPEVPEMRIFIGHGRGKAWEELKNHLQDKHGYKVEAFESGERAGHAVRDILEDMLNRSSLALLVLTGEDETAEGGIRARQNVIHETGLFQGRLGFSRAIVLLEEGVETFSNNHGIQYIPFGKGSIRSTFGDVLAVIKRESFSSAKG